MHGRQMFTDDQVFGILDHLVKGEGQTITAGGLKARTGIGHARACRLLHDWRERNPGFAPAQEPDNETARAIFAVLRTRLMIVKEAELADIATTIAAMLATREKAQ